MRSMLTLASQTPAPSLPPVHSAATLTATRFNTITNKSTPIKVRREPFPCSPSAPHRATPLSPTRVPPISPQRVPPILPHRLPPSSCSFGAPSNTSRVSNVFADHSAVASDSIPSDSEKNRGVARSGGPSSTGGTGVLRGVPRKPAPQRYRTRLPSLPETIVTASCPSATSSSLGVSWSLPLLSQHRRCQTMKWHPDKRTQSRKEKAPLLGPGEYDSLNLWKNVEKPAVTFPSRFAKAAHLVCAERDADHDIEQVIKSHLEECEKSDSGDRVNALGEWKRARCEEWNVFSSDDDALGFERETCVPEIKSSKNARRYARRDAALLLDGSFADSLLNGRPNLLVHALLYDVETNHDRTTEKKRFLAGGRDSSLQSLAAGTLALEQEVEQSLPLALGV